MGWGFQSCHLPARTGCNPPKIPNTFLNRGPMNVYMTMKDNHNEVNVRGRARKRQLVLGCLGPHHEKSVGSPSSPLTHIKGAGHSFKVSINFDWWVLCPHIHQLHIYVAYCWALTFTWMYTHTWSLHTSDWKGIQQVGLQGNTHKHVNQNKACTHWHFTLLRIWCSDQGQAEVTMSGP